MGYYIDEGISGKSLNRPQFIAMTRQQEREHIDYVVVYRLDRISRNTKDFAILIDDYKKKGIKFISINDGFDTSTTMGQAMMRIASVLAELERDNIAERVRDNMAMLARTGRWLGGPAPYGYKIVIDDKYDYSNGKKPIKRLIEDENTYVVKAIYNKFIEIESLSAVVKYLHSNGYKSPKKEYFSNIGIKQILQNPTYCVADEQSYNYFAEHNSNICFNLDDCDGNKGLMCNNKRDYSHDKLTKRTVNEWIIALGNHTGIIDSTTWLKAQKIFERRAKDNKELDNKNHYSLLSGLLQCAKCGEPMFSKRNSTNENVFYYICATKQRVGTKGCSCANLQGNETDEFIANQLFEYANINLITYVYLKNIKFDETANNDIAIRIESIANVIRQIKKDKDKLLTVLLHEDISKDLIMSVDVKVKELIEQEQQANRTLEKLEEEQNAINEKGTQLQALKSNLKSFKSSFSVATFIEKRNTIRELIDHIEWDGENLRVFLMRE